MCFTLAILKLQKLVTFFSLVLPWATKVMSDLLFLLMCLNKCDAFICYIYAYFLSVVDWSAVSIRVMEYFCHFFNVFYVTHLK